MLVRLDQQILLFLNSLHTPFWDNVMWVVSGTWIWTPLYVAILFLIYKRVSNKQHFFILLLFIALTILLTDQISSSVFKNLVRRPRPTHEPALEGLVHTVRGYTGGLYGFVSSHAANNFGIVTLSALLIKKRWFTVAMTLSALLICYSRIYLGVHYLGDIICGAVLGILIGWGVYKLYIATFPCLYNSFQRKKRAESPKEKAAPIE